MDSLLANYASSDEEGEAAAAAAAAAAAKSSSNKPKPSFFSTLPPPKTSSSSSSIFSSLPPPKSQHHQEQPPPPPPPPPKSTTSKPQSSLFSHLPPPKSQPSSKDQTPNPKRVVQFTLPFDPSLLNSNHPDDDDEIGRKQPVIEDSSSSSSSKALSSMLPAPKNSLCLAPKKTHVPNPERIDTEPERANLDQERTRIGDYGGSHGGTNRAAQLEPHLSNPEDQERSNFEGSESHYDANWVAQPDTHNQGWSQFGDHGGYPVEDYGGYGGSSNESGGGGDYVGGNWNDGSTAGAATGIAAPDVPEMGRIAGKRGRKEIPTEMLEVKQDELMKNRPRADQAKLTGIAFGPAYQPMSTSKGKPSKLHKRKHQIGSLFFDMKQKEMELAERRAKGFLTKAETQAKYGW